MSGGAIDLVLVGYSPERTARALVFCERAFAGLPLRQRLLVLNDPAMPDPAPHEKWQTLRGSNALGEFSGWQEGLARLEPLGKASGVLFLNDTVGAHRNLSAFRRWAMREEVRHATGATFVGFTEDSNRALPAVTIRGMNLESWISSYCFFLTTDTLRLLGGRLFDAEEVASCVAGGTVEDEFFTQELSPNLRQHLQWWLFEGWYRSESPTAESERRLNLKARCICAELLLTAHCQALGVVCRDPMKRRPIIERLETINSWRFRLLHGAGTAPIDGRPPRAAPPL